MMVIGYVFMHIQLIIEHDKTLLSLPDLREGEKVRRSNINELWEKY